MSFLYVMLPVVTFFVVVGVVTAFAALTRSWRARHRQGITAVGGLVIVLFIAAVVGSIVFGLVSPPRGSDADVECAGPPTQAC